MRLIPVFPRQAAIHDFWKIVRKGRVLLTAACILTLPVSLAAQVLSFAGAQSTLTTGSLVTAPIGVALDASGNSYVLNQGATTSIVKISPAGVQTQISFTGVTLSTPLGIAVDNQGYFYVSDSGHNHVVKVPVAGGAAANMGGTLSHPSGVAVDSAANVYIADTGDHRVVKVNAGTLNGTSLVAGSYTTPVGLAMDQAGNLYISDTGATSLFKVALINSAISTPLSNLTDLPKYVTVDTAGTIFLSGGTSQTLSSYGLNGTIRQLGTGLAAPTGISVDSTGNVYVADQTSHAIDIVAPGSVDLGQANLCPSSGTQTAPCSETVTLHFNVASSASLSSVTAHALTQGTANLDFTSTTNTCTGTLTGPTSCAVTVVFKALAPGTRLGAVDVTGISGSASTATLLATVPLHGLGMGPLVGLDAATINALPLTVPNPSYLSGVIADSVGNLYFIDNHACTVDKFTVSTATSNIVAGTTCGATNSGTGVGGPAANAILVDPWRLALSGRGDLFIADDGAAVIWKVDALTGIITTAAGTLNSAAHSPDGSVAATSAVQYPFALAFDGAGDLYFADWADETVRKIDADSGTLITVAGNHNEVHGYSGDGGPATAAQLDFPIAIALDPAGNLYIADNHNSVIRKVTLATGDISTVAGVGLTPGHSGDGAAATSAELTDPEGVAVDAAGNLYIADSGNYVVRKVNAATGIISDIGGLYTGTKHNTGDGGAANLAGLSYIQDVAVDSSGNFYIVDSDNSLIREVTASGGVVSFGSANIGTASSAIDVVLTNNGNAALALTALASPTNFNLDGADTSCTSSTTLSTAADCTMGVEFLPTAAGSLTGSLTLTDDAGNNPGSTQSLALSGTGDYVPTQVVLAGVPAATTTSGNLGSIQASIESSGNNVVTNSTASVTATVTGPGSYSQAVTGSAVSGVATLDLSGLTFTTAGSYTVTAASNGLTSATATVSVTYPPATQAVLSGLPVTVYTGGNLGTATVSIETASGSTVSGSSSASATLTITGPGAYSQTSTISASNGVATFDLTSMVLTTTGAYTVTATSNGLTSSNATVNVVPPPPTQLALSSLPASIVAGGNLGTATVSVENAAGAVVTTSSASVSLTITGPGGYSQVASTAAASGIATFNLTPLALTTPGTYNVIAASNGLASATAMVTVVPLPSTQLALSGLPASIIAGGNLGTALVTIEAANGSTSTTSSASVTVTITGPSGYSQAVTAAAASGIATFNLNSLTLTATGAYTVTATSAGLTASSATVSVNPQPATQLALSGVAASIGAGGNLGTATASVETATGVVVATSSAAVTLTITGPGSYTQTVTATAASGVATFNLSALALASTGSYTVTVTSVGLTPANTIVTVVPPPATQLAISGLAASIVTGGNLGTAIVKVEDVNGSVVTTTSAPVMLAITGPGGYSQTLTVAARSGVATFSLSLLPLSSVGTYTVTATSTGLTTATATVSVTPLPPALLAVSGIPTTIAAGGNLGTATVTFEAADKSVVITSTAPATIIITGPGSYSQSMTATAVSGVATLDLSSLVLVTAGTYTVTTSSPGLPSVTVTVPVTFTLTISGGSSGSSASIAAGGAATFTFTLAATTSSYAQPVTFVATGLPTGATATFSPATLTPGPAAVSTTLTIQTAASTAALHRLERIGNGAGGLALCLLLLPLAASRRLRKAARQLPMLSVLFGLLSLAGVCGLAGCGGGSHSASGPQTYAITVTGTSGGATGSTTVSLTVQ